MKKKTYLSISITYYNVPCLKPSVHYYRADNIHAAVSISDKLTVDEANWLMWVLVKLGGKNSYESNWFDNSICTRQVTFWGYL